MSTSLGWEGNRRSGVALAMSHRQWWFIHLPLACEREMSHTILRSMALLHLYLYYNDVPFKELNRLSNNVRHLCQRMLLMYELHCSWSVERNVLILFAMSVAGRSIDHAYSCFRGVTLY